MESAPLRLDLIIRTSKRKKETRSPQQQRDMAEACAAANGYEIVHVHDSGTDESGKTMNRTSILAAMDRVKAGLSDGVIVALADRIGRAPIEESMTTVREFCLAGKLVLADMGGRPVDLHNGVEETNVVMQLQFARQYWLTTAMRMQRSQRDAIAAGRYPRLAPRGYRKIAGGAEKGKLTPDPVHAPIMREAFRLSAFNGLHASMAHLEIHYPEIEWDTSRVRRLLAPRVYLGEIHYNCGCEHCLANPSRPGESPERIFEPNLEAHDALVTPELYALAQHAAGDRRSNDEYPLSHLVHCECGAGLVGGLQTFKHRGYSYRRMRCAACNRCSIRAEALEGYILAELKLSLASAPFRAMFGADGLAEAREAVARAKASRRKLLLKMDPDDEDFDVVKAQWDQRVIDAEKAYHALVARAHQADELPAPDELDDPVKFERALQAANSVGRFVVAYASKGARVPVEDRVRFEVGDDLAGPLAA